jgi:hypothetical protein
MAQSSNDHWAAVEPVVNRELYGLDPRVPPQWSQIFSVSSDTEPQRSAVEYGGGARTLTLKPENTAVGQTQVFQGPLKTWYTQSFAAAATLSEELAQDASGKYAKLTQAIGQLGEASRVFPELLCAQMLDNAFDSTKPQTADGVEICGTHTLPGSAGTSSNKMTIPAALDQASLEAVRIALKGIKNPSGNIGPMRIRKLVVPSAYDVIAEKLRTTRQSVGDANNDTNVMSGTDSVTFDYLSSQTKWFALTDKANPEMGLFWDWIKKVTYVTDQPALMLQKVFIAWARARYGIVDWRYIYGVGFAG